MILLPIFSDAMSTEPVTSPSISITSISLIILSAVLWGSTDAAMKYFSPSDKSSNTSGWVACFISLLSTPSYLLCLVTNQVGSLVYYYTLATAPLSVVNPAVNTGKVLVNVLVRRVLGEQQLSGRKLVGLSLLLAGIVLQITA